MKKLILLFVLLISISLNAQTRKEEYKDYKACDECFDHWESTGSKMPAFEGKTSNNDNSRRNNGVVRQELKKVVAVAVGIVVTIFTYKLYTKLTDSANGVSL